MNAPSTASPLDRARRKAYVRLMPLLFVSFVIAYVDRANVAFAKLTMEKDLPWLTSDVFGYASGVFFLGYVLLEIPGSLLVERWSARKWLARIMVTWGIIASLTATVKTPGQFYAVRFLLGLAEAGFFPGVIVFLSHWFPARDRAKALATFLIASPIAQVVGPPLSGLLLPIGTDALHPEVLGLEGWQWVYIVWGVPAVVLGVLVLFFLPDRPAHARWLSAEERDALVATLAADEAGASRGRHMGVLEALRNPKVLLLAAGFLCVITANYGLEFFLPTILQRWFGLVEKQILWLIVVPPAIAVVGQLFVAWSSDRTRERRLHASVPILLASVSLVLLPAASAHLTLAMVFFVLAKTGVKAYVPAFWALPTLFLTRSAAAASIGFINSVGNLGGALGPSIVGLLDRLTGSFVGALYVLAGMAVLAAVLIGLAGVGRSVREGA
jgi:MFS transporter, ACS family, tartrate transporter